MNRRVSALIACVAPWLAAAAPAPPHPAPPAHAVPARALPVPMTVQTGTELDATARRLAAADLKDATAAGETPLVLVGSARLGGPNDPPALFVQLQSSRECGSSGCSTSAYLSGPKGWRKVLDDAIGPVTVDAAQHRGMHDLLVGRNDRWIWNGTVYADSRPVPVLSLRPHVPPKAQHK